MIIGKAEWEVPQSWPWTVRVTAVVSQATPKKATGWKSRAEELSGLHEDSDMDVEDGFKLPPTFNY